MSTALTVDQATALLRNNPGAYTTPDQLKTLASQVDANSPGRLTVAYSGGVANGVWSTDIVEAMLASGEDVRVINQYGWKQHGPVPAAVLNAAQAPPVLQRMRLNELADYDNAALV